MINYLPHSKIDKSLWDRCIMSSPQGEVYSCSWFLDIISPGWDALVSGNYDFVFPLTKRKKFGFDYLYQPYFTQQLGLFSKGPVTQNEVKNFLEAIPAKYRLVEIQLNTGNKLTDARDYEVVPRKTHHLDLSPDIEKLRSSYSENLRRNLKKASAGDSILAKNCGIENIVSLFRMNRGNTIENLQTSDYDTFMRLMNTAFEKNLLEISCVKNQKDETTAGALFLKSVHSWIFIFSATSEEGKQNGAMSRIIDSFISSHSGEKTILDFEGSMDPNLARYYKSFGSQEVVYLQVRKNKLPSLIRWLK